ncbi:MAG: hypothetical protein H0Z32_14295 [Bacillaceae bacterium]|nr:hypothetical protein [Bacillaceae bacterium]
MDRYDSAFRENFEIQEVLRTSTADAIPFVSTTKGIQQLITGQDLMTGEQLSVGDRIAEGFGLAASIIPIPGSKIAGKYVGKGAVFAGKGIWKGARSLGSIASKAGSKLKSGFQSAKEKVTTGLKNTGEKISSGFRQTKDKITSGVSKAKEKVKSAGSKLWGGIKGLFGKKKKKPDKNNNNAIQGNRVGGPGYLQTFASKGIVNLPSTINYTNKQLQKKFKHAGDFGVSGNFNKNNATKFRNALDNHIQNAEHVYSSKIGGVGEVYVYIRDKNLAVFVDKGDNFVSGWRLTQEQLDFHTKHYGTKIK